MVLTTLVAATALAASAQTADSNNYAFQTKLRSLAVFQQGFGYYVREGSVRLEGGVANTNLVPPASAGTYGVFSSDPRVKLDSLFVTTDNRIQFNSPADLRGKLQDKIGLELRIVTKEAETKQGLLFNLIDEYVLLKAGDGNLIPIKYEDVGSVALAAFPLRMVFETPNPNEPIKLGLTYVQRGVIWLPSYELEMTGDDRGMLRMRGTLMGLPEDAENIDLTFVVGTPQLSGLHQLDPLFSGVQSGAVLAPDDIEFISYDPMEGREPAAARPAPGGVGGGGFGGAMAAEVTNQAGTRMEGSGELFYYTKPNFTMRQGERALVTIFEESIPVETRFEWFVDQGLITFILNLKNQTDKAFAAGPVFVTKDRRPLGMQNIEPAPPGGETELRLATGVGLRTDSKERVTETAREQGPTSPSGPYMITRNKIAGTLTIESLRDLPSTVKVVKSVMGTDVEAGQDGDVLFTQAQGPQGVYRIEWNVTVPPKGKVTLNYGYTQVSTGPAVGPGGPFGFQGSN